MVDLIDENVDCVVRGGDLGELSLAARHVGDLAIGLYAAPAYLARVGRPAHPRELEAAPHQIVGFLRSSTGRTLPCTLRRGEERVQVLGRYAIAMDDGNAYLAAGVACLGALWLPRYMAAPHLACGELAPLFEDWSIEPMPLYIAFPPNRHMGARLRVFIDWVVELMEIHAPLTEGNVRSPTQ